LTVLLHARLHIRVRSDPTSISDGPKEFFQAEASTMARELPDKTSVVQGRVSDYFSPEARVDRLLRNAREAHRFWREFARRSALYRIPSRGSHYNPNQPRVPAGHPDGGQWTSTGGSGTRLAANEKGPGGGIRGPIIVKFFQELIDAFRRENGPWDLFEYKRGTVTVTEFNGKHIFGSNSKSPTYSRADRDRAEAIRRILIDKYPDVMKSDNIGEKPNDALFHAEATVLLRAARENGGTLKGQTLEVFACVVVAARSSLIWAWSWVIPS
jgi:hypothetical protein